MNNKFLLNQSGIAPELTTRQSRSDSLSFVSRQSVLATLLLCLTFFVGSGNVWGADYTCTFTKLTSGSEISSYTKSHTFTSGSVTWTVYGNQSVDDSDIRVGGKNTTNTDRTLTSGKISISVSKFTINHLGTGNGKSSSITINSIKLEVANNSSFTGADVITKNSLSVGSSGSLEYIPTSGTSWAANSYYRVTVNYNITGSNNCYIKIGSFVCKEASSCTSISPSLSYAGGTSLTVGATSGSPTITGNTGNGTVTYSSNNTSVATVNSSTGVVTAVAAGNATITASIAAKGVYCEGSATSNFTITVPAYTVQFSTGTGNPTVSSRTEASGGAGITLPAGPTPACSSDGWNFAGWGYESCDDESTEPTLYIPGTTYYPESDETLYAVYVKNKTASTNYKLISSGAQLVSGENYVIAAYYSSNDYAITAEIQSSYYIKQTAVTVNASNIISNPGAKTIWQLTKETGSNVSLYNSNQSKYLYVYASGSYRNLGLYDSKKQFTMTEEREAGYASTFAFNSTDYTSYYINYDASHTYFGTKTSSDENLYLYKRQYTGTYESNPTCCTPLGSINGSSMWAYHKTPLIY